MLAATAGDEEEAAVLTAGEVRVRPRHSLAADHQMGRRAKAAEVRALRRLGEQAPAAGALVIWRNARLRFAARQPAGHPVPLVRPVARNGQAHPAGIASSVRSAQDDFGTHGETKAPLRILVPDGTIAGRLDVEVELDSKHGADAIVRCSITDEAAGETPRRSATSILLGNPASPTVAIGNGVAEFARLAGGVAPRAAPSDRDPIPLPFDNTYNLPERNHFHYAIKYHRDDRFLVEHVLDDATRRRARSGLDRPADLV